MPEVRKRLSEDFDTNSEIFKAVLKVILAEVLTPAERRIAVKRICPETINLLPVDKGALPKTCKIEVGALADKIKRILIESGVPLKKHPKHASRKH
ncbi:MAG: hypothetical protein K0S38_3 [Candidatus Paceibacter sp.]|jgi:hypothetical protein|nr:hypothetical protein [Candidatus Paceibacter sp.]